MTALAAVATFGKAGLDDPMSDNPPTALILYNGNLQRMELSRRRFMCLLFSYLTALSMAITVVAIGLLTFADQARAAVTPALVDLVRGVTAFVFLFLVGQMATITLWGLYYVGERMHTPD